MIELKLNRKLFAPIYLPHVYDYGHRYEVYYGGAGSGKSYFIAQKLLIKACGEKRKILIMRKVAATLKDSVWQLIVDLLSKWRILSYCKVNLSTLTITLPNGSMLLFKGLDDSEKIKSITGITDIWCEEATELTEDDFTQLDLRLRAKAPNLQMLLSFNPTSKANWCYHHWFENATEAMILQTTYKDNPFLPQSYIDSLESMMNTNPTYYRIYALGEFCSLDKLVYTNWRISDEDVPQGAQIMIGLDFGYINDPSALIVSYIDESTKKIYIRDEVYRTGMLNDEIARLIAYKSLQKEVIIADSAEQKSIEEIKRLGVYRIRPAAKGSGSVLQGIQKLQQYELIVHPSCVNTITELQNYAWKKDKNSNEYINEPKDDFNHLLDALRYSIQTFDKSNRLQSISKAGLGI